MARDRVVRPSSHGGLVSPILVRPVREQLEHDRVIRLLQAKYRRKYDAVINPGSEQLAPVTSGNGALYPDLVLFSMERGRRLQAIVEVETGESVNHLEALAEWANFGRVRAAFHLYVPSGAIDVARRLCEDKQIRVAEFWSFHTVGDEVRFTLVHRSREAASPSTSRPARPIASPARRTGSSRVRKAAAQPTERSPRRAKPSSNGKRARKTAATQKRK
jgi:hypothetical protein